MLEGFFAFQYVINTSEYPGPTDFNTKTTWSNIVEWNQYFTISYCFCSQFEFSQVSEIIKKHGDEQTEITIAYPVCTDSTSLSIDGCFTVPDSWDRVQNADVLTIDSEEIWDLVTI